MAVLNKARGTIKIEELPNSIKYIDIKRKFI